MYLDQGFDRDHKLKGWLTAKYGGQIENRFTFCPQWQAIDNLRGFNDRVTSFENCKSETNDRGRAE